MDQASLESSLADLELPAVRYFQSIDSTNDEAWRWVEIGAPHAALVVADEQTAGRGRYQRRWITARNTGLAFSLILRSPAFQVHQVHLLTGLGGLAVCLALQDCYSIPAQVKWPNDVLLGGGKAAGILVEARWEGEKLNAAVVGIGINIAPESINPDTLSSAGLDVPATCVECFVDHPVDRLELLHAILGGFLSWLPRLAISAFINLWEANLAYRDQWVVILPPSPGHLTGRPVVHPPIYAGKLVGLTMDGSVKILTASGELVTAQVGELHLRPVGPPG
ncbi:MAG: biotin--[acetyl-CoA-carboxylase] ligase [Anaerolineales bacterium]|nr:MAG: biotin--[acetyl-CoA-carboxylase] ligase [Anaerolineales bacterium]